MSTFIFAISSYIFFNVDSFIFLISNFKSSPIYLYKWQITFDDIFLNCGFELLHKLTKKSIIPFIFKSTINNLSSIVLSINSAYSFKTTTFLHLSNKDNKKSITDFSEYEFIKESNNTIYISFSFESAIFSYKPLIIVSK